MVRLSENVGKWYPTEGSKVALQPEASTKSTESRTHTVAVLAYTIHPDTL